MNHSLTLGRAGTLANTLYLLVRVTHDTETEPIMNTLTDLKNRFPIPIVFQPLGPITDLRPKLKELYDFFKTNYGARITLRTDQNPDIGWNYADWIIYESTVEDYRGVFADELWLTWSPDSPDLEAIPNKVAKGVPVTVRPSSPGQLSDIIAWSLRQNFPVGIGQ